MTKPHPITMTCPVCKGAACWSCHRLGWVLIPMATVITRKVKRAYA